MVIRIKRRSQAEWLTLYMFIMPFAFCFLIDFLHLPSAVKYTVDIAWVLLLFILLLSKTKIQNVYLRGCIGAVGLLFFATLIGYVVNMQSVFFYLWGFRNNFRFFVFFAACALWLKKDSIGTCLRLIERLFWINLLVTLWQFFVLDKSGDYLGGIFGVEKGCNAYTNVFIMIYAMWHVLCYMHNKETIWECLFKNLAAIVVAAFAELKMYYIELVVLITLASMMTRFSIKKIWIIAGTVCGLAMGIALLGSVFPEFSKWFTIRNILETASSQSGYTSSGDLNRLTAMGISLRLFLTNWAEKLFGLGLGSCDYASGIDFLTTSFYLKNANLNYTWFSSAMLLLETGLVGVGLYAAFFCQVFYGAHKMEKAGEDALICQMAKIMAVMSGMLFIYNGSLRMESAYMVFFVLAMPFIGMNEAEPQRKLSSV